MYTYTYVHTPAPQAKPHTGSYTRSNMQTHTCTHMREHISTLTLYHICERGVLSRAFGCEMVRIREWGPQRSWDIRVGFWGTLIPMSDGSSWRKGFYFCNIWPVSAQRWRDLAHRKFRENKLMWSIQSLHDFLFRSYQRAGPGGELPWSRPLWKEFSLGKFICSQMQDASSISALERSGSLLLYHFVPALTQVRQERRILYFGIPNRIIHHLFALTMESSNSYKERRLRKITSCYQLVYLLPVCDAYQ